VQAVEAGTGVVSRSNEICIQADIIQAAKDMFIKNVTVTPGNQVEVTWAWNTNAEINEVQILSSPQNANYQPVLTQTAQLPLPPEVTYVDGSAQPDNNSVFYKIQTRDDCDSLALSTYGATIFLSGEIQSSSVNRLKWNSLDLQGAVVTGYEIFKVIGGGTPASMGTVNGTTTTFDDHFDPTNLAETKACYYVIATANLTTPAGGVITIQSRSNTTCAEKDVLILVPNAFAPEGYNQRFKPLILLADLASYEMRIFDRNGQEVFISRSKDDGWNGRKGGKNLPQGTYVYQIRVIQANGRITEKRGMVLLLR
jgi:gliding motility-associated-like protein